VDDDDRAERAFVSWPTCLRKGTSQRGVVSHCTQSPEETSVLNEGGGGAAVSVGAPPAGLMDVAAAVLVKVGFIFSASAAL
jgi:hypothetical protein